MTDETGGSGRSGSRPRRAEDDRKGASLQREVSGRLLKEAIDGIERLDVAERRLTRLDHLSDFERRLQASLDPAATRETVSHVVLPELDAWAVVDLCEDGVPLRLCIVHADSAKRPLVEALNQGWRPQADDTIGYEAARRVGNTFVVVPRTDDELRALAQSEHNAAILRGLGVGACLVVPLRRAGEIEGAITFVSTRTEFTDEDVAYAERLASACERALGNAAAMTAANEKALRAELATRAQTSMLGYVTHELRTPLSAIGGYAELMQLGVRGPVTDDQRSDLDRIRWNQQHLLAVITQILEYVRADTGHLDVTIADFDLAVAARSAAEMLEPLLAPEQRLSVHGCPAGRILARGDLGKTRQIVINLVTNALKYSAPDSEIAVRCGVVDDGVFVEVADRGEGIPDDSLESIFEPFVQLESGHASRGGGVGLGLPIARRLAHMMHGTLAVSSVPGEGATFRLTLPAGGPAGHQMDRPA
jgi:signal transduction histidine kinase